MANLQNGQTYYVRARHQDNSQPIIGNWSTPSSFKKQEVSILPPTQEVSILPPTYEPIMIINKSPVRILLASSYVPAGHDFILIVEQQTDGTFSIIKTYKPPFEAYNDKHEFYCNETLSFCAWKSDRRGDDPGYNRLWLVSLNDITHKVDIVRRLNDIDCGNYDSPVGGCYDIPGKIAVCYLDSQVMFVNSDLTLTPTQTMTGSNPWFSLDGTHLSLRTLAQPPNNSRITIYRRILGSPQFNLVGYVEFSMPQTNVGFRTDNKAAWVLNGNNFQVYRLDISDNAVTARFHSNYNRSDSQGNRVPDTIYGDHAKAWHYTGGIGPNGNYVPICPD